jgi:nucleotide-binding universal stress UspA family protein
MSSQPGRSLYRPLVAQSHDGRDHPEDDGSAHDGSLLPPGSRSDFGMFQRILVPTDGSQAATEASEQAIELATLCDATVHSLHVVERPHRQSSESLTDIAMPALPEETLADREHAGERLTAAVADRATERDLDTKTAVTRGIAHETILEYVEARDIDLIVMGTHGRSGLDRWLIGSVTERVIRQTNVPVHVVRGPE